MSNEEFYRSNFLEFDADGNGHLCYPEFRQHIIKILNHNLSDLATRNLYDGVEKETDEYITVDEWVNALNKISLKDVGTEELKNIFNQMDQTGDGKVTKEEIKNALLNENSSITEENLEEMFKIADTSGDGYISIDEFTTAFYSEMQHQ